MDDFSADKLSLAFDPIQVVQCSGLLAGDHERLQQEIIYSSLSRSSQSDKAKRFPSHHRSGGAYEVWRRLANQRWNDAWHSPLRRPANSPSTLICSSISGHSIAVPFPKTSQFRRSASVAC